MKPWTRYILMRFPLQEQIPLITGLLLTGALSHFSALDLSSIIISAIGLIAFFWLARLQIDTRDYLQDTHRNQNQKPLARSLLRLNDLKTARWFTWLIIIAYGVLLTVLNFSWSGYSLLATGLWLGLASRNYFLRSILSGHPFIHSVLDYSVMIGITSFSVTAFQPQMIDWIKIICMGGIFALVLMNRELVKNLDPHSHSILKNYHSLIGAERTWIAMILISVLMIALSTQIGWWIPVATTQTAFHLFFAVLYLRPKRWDLIARFSYWIFIIYAWIIPFKEWMKSHT